MDNKESAAITETRSNTEVRYVKQQIITSDKFSAIERDVLSVLLKNDETYTLEQARAVLDAFARMGVR